MPQDDDDERKESNEKESADNKQDMTKVRVAWIVLLSFNNPDSLWQPFLLALLLQKVYGDYEILKAIGKGKFAVVYRAKRKSDGEIGMSFADWLRRCFYVLHVEWRCNVLYNLLFCSVLFCERNHQLRV